MKLSKKSVDPTRITIDIRIQQTDNRRNRCSINKKNAHIGGGWSRDSWREYPLFRCNQRYRLIDHLAFNDAPLIASDPRVYFSSALLFSPWKNGLNTDIYNNRAWCINSIESFRIFSLLPRICIENYEKEVVERNID